MKIYAAPLQGYTTAVWRQCHTAVVGGVDAYFTPFIRVERGAPASRSLRDAQADRTAIPQIIFRDMDELRMLCDALVAQGYDAIDLNMGCPFVPQVKHGRGAAVVANIPLLEALAKDIADRYAAVSFSVKMRLGVDDPDQWRPALSVINDMPLHHLCVHPRTATMQYGGSPMLDVFDEIAVATTQRLVYNGDIRTPEQARTIVDRYPGLYGIMIGRGLLGRPTLAAEIREGRAESPECRREKFLTLHDAIYKEALTRYCGASQILSHIKPYWDYAEDFADERRALKAIAKAHSLSAYDAAVNALR